MLRQTTVTALAISVIGWLPCACDGPPGDHVDMPAPRLVGAADQDDGQQPGETIPWPGDELPAGDAEIPAVESEPAPPTSPPPPSDSPPSPPPSSQPPPPSSSCDPAFRGPFCTGTICDAQGNCETVEDNLRIIGFSMAEPAAPTVDEIRLYTLAAINTLRARTCLPPLTLDSCLNQIAEQAFASGGVSHGYFLANCMNASTNFGRQCQCNWTQENGGASAGSGRTWVDGVHNPLCRMMTEGYGTGHRANIECKHWTRIGIAGKFTSSGGSWLHEFGCDASLASCPKVGDP